MLGWHRPGESRTGMDAEEISDPLYLLELDPDPPLAFGPGLEVVDYGRTSPENERSGIRCGKPGVQTCR